MHAVEHGGKGVVNVETLVRLPEDLMKFRPVRPNACVFVVECDYSARNHEDDTIGVVTGAAGTASGVEKFLSLKNFASFGFLVKPAVLRDDDELAGQVHTLSHSGGCGQDTNAVGTFIE